MQAVWVITTLAIDVMLHNDTEARMGAARTVQMFLMDGTQQVVSSALSTTGLGECI